MTYLPLSRATDIVVSSCSRIVDQRPSADQRP
jgi:hypothetical protein